MEFTTIKKSHDEEGYQIEKLNKKTLLSNTNDYSCPNFVTELKRCPDLPIKDQAQIIKCQLCFFNKYQA